MSPQPAPESAAFLRDFLVERIRDEHACTNRVFAELHDGDWRPDPKSRSARELACTSPPASAGSSPLSLTSSLKAEATHPCPQPFPR